jgi:glycosyltransferase involved in cell wall biosynthesis
MATAISVSIVIPTHNRAAYLADALDSVFAQNMPNLEVIVVDDHSTDDTAGVLARYDGRIHVVTRASSSHNPGRVRNDGLRAARGKYVAFLDSDDMWVSGKLGRQLAILDSDPDCGFVFGNVVFVENGVQTPPAVAAGSLPSGWILEALAADMFVHPSTLVVRRTLVERVGRFSELVGTAEEYDFLLRIARLARGTAVDVPLAVVRRHGNQHSRAHIVDNYRNAIASLEHVAADRALSSSIRSTARRTIARHHTTVARLLCTDGQSAAARRHIRAALRRHPFSGSAWRTAFRSLSSRPPGRA